MSSFGVLPEGFKLKTLEDILTELKNAEVTALGSGLNTAPDSVIGQLNAIFGDQFAQLWKVALAVYRSLYPDSASFEALDNVAAITGALRLAALPSTVLLDLVLNASTTVPLGSLVAIGAKGARWKTLEAAVNSSLFQETVQVHAESVDTGPIAGASTAIDTIISPISGWVARAAVESTNDENFVLADSQTLLVAVDGDDPQTIVFDAGDFVDITAATAAEVVDAINATIQGATALVNDSLVRIVSNTDGTGSAIEVTGGTSNMAFGFRLYEIRGFNPDTPAVVQSGNPETYALVDAQTLLVAVDRGAPQTVTFHTGDFVAIGAATAIEVARKINSSLSGACAYMTGNSYVVIQSLTNGPDGFVQVTGGTAVALGFDTTIEGQGISGDADPGRNLETDAEFRLRREQLLRLSGAGTLESIRSGVLSVTGVVQVFIFENDTDDDPDANGLPPHSFECIVSGGDDDAIAAKIFALKPVGIKAYGADGPFTVTDSQGIDHDILFTRPTEFEEFIKVTVKVNADVFGGGDTNAGKTQVIDALVAFGQTLNIGDDVIINKFIAAAIEVAGVIDVTVMKIEDADPPTNTANITIGPREIALFAAVRVTVTVI